MAPPVSAIPVSDLETQLNTLPSGRARNPPIVLGDCALRELVQYKCNVYPATTAQGGVPRVICEPVVRMLRKCQGGLSVETTAWEAKQQDAHGERY